MVMSSSDSKDMQKIQLTRFTKLWRFVKMKLSRNTSANIETANRELFEDKLINLLEEIAGWLGDIAESQRNLSDDSYKRRIQ